MADQVVLLRDGKIEQQATPTVIYQRPASLFVAQFIGSTKMNVLLLHGQKIAGTEITVPAPVGAISMGIRPEDISFSGDMPSHVLSTEFTGADLLVHTQIGNQPLTARADGKAVISPRAQINLGWQLSNLHWFDAEGLRIQ